MEDITIRDIIENDIRIKGIWNVKATMYFEGVLDDFFNFHDDLRDGELNKLLDIPEEIDEDSWLAEYIENDLDPEILVIQVETPVKKKGEPYSWGYTKSYYAKGKTLQELYNNAYNLVKGE